MFPIVYSTGHVFLLVTSLGARPSCEAVPKDDDVSGDGSIIVNASPPNINTAASSMTCSYTVD